MAILLDTSLLVAYHNKRDDHHERARSLEIDDPAVNDYIYTETLNMVMNRNSHSKAVDYGEFLRKSLKIFRVSKPVFDEAVRKFREHGVSFTDASLAATAEKLEIGKIASFDEDFDRFDGIERIH